MLLGNKCDMADRRVVSRERGEKIASDHGIRFLETSAKANIQIDKAFYDLAEAILDKVLNNLNNFFSLEPIFLTKMVVFFKKSQF